MVAPPALAEDFLPGAEVVRLLHSAPVILGNRAPQIRERYREAMSGTFEHRVRAVLDRELRLEARGDAPGEQAPLRLRRKGGERREAFGGRQFQPVECERAAL